MRPELLKPRAQSRQPASPLPKTQSHVGPCNCNQGLQASVCCKTPSFQWGYSICSNRGFGSGAGSRNILLLGEKSYKASSSEGLLLLLFSNFKERWGFAPDNGPVCSKQALKEIQIQDAHNRGSHSLQYAGGNWFAVVDLNVDYFHISIYPAHRKYLRFSFQNEAYEFVTLLPGLSLAPRMFSRCIEAALSPLRYKGLRISAYLDDLLIFSHSRERRARHRDTHVSSHESVVQDQVRQKPAGSLPGDRVSRVSSLSRVSTSRTE